MASVSHGQYRLFVDDEIDGVDTTANTLVVAPAATVPGAIDVAVPEVLGFCPRLLSGLPLAVTLVCSHAAAGQVVLTTSQPVHAATCRSWPTYTGRELAALALGAEHERASPSVFAEWCVRKRDSTWRLEPSDALGEVPGRFDVLGRVTVGQTLAAYGLVLRAVGVGDELPEVTHAE